MRKIASISLIALFAIQSTALAQLRKDTAKRDAYVTVNTDVSDSINNELFSDIKKHEEPRIGLLSSLHSSSTTSTLDLYSIPRTKLSVPGRFAGGSAVTPNGTPRFRRVGLLGSLLFPDHPESDYAVPIKF